MAGLAGTGSIALSLRLDVVHPEAVEAAGELETRNVWIRPLRLEYHRGDRFGFLLRGTREVLTEPFEISDGIVIPPGDYDFDSYRVELEFAGERTLAPRAEINKGDFYNGTWLQVDTAVDWRPSSRWYFSNIQETAGINGRLRWKPRAGEDLYIVLNHESEAMAAFSGFRARASEVTVKYNRTFRF